MKNKISNHLIGQILKIIEKAQNSSQEERQAQNNQLLLSKTTVSNKNNEYQERSIVLKKRQKALNKRVYRLHPNLQTNHIYKFFGFFPINEKGIEDPQLEQSYFFNYCHERAIEKIQHYNNAIVLEMPGPSMPTNQPSVQMRYKRRQYIVERFKSKGCAKYYELAQLLEQVHNLYFKFSNKNFIQDKIEATHHILDPLGDSMFIVCLGLRKLAISKSLLRYLEYDIEQFSVNAIKYRSVSEEFISSLNYAPSLKHLLNNLINLYNFSQGKISATQFNASTTHRFTDFLTSKNHVRSFCDMSFSFLNTAHFMIKVQFIYYKQDTQLKGGSLQSPVQLAVQDEKDKIKQRQYQVLRRIKNMPGLTVNKSQSRVVGYKDIPRSMDIESQNQP